MTETQTVDLAAWLTRIWDEEERHAHKDIHVVGQTGGDWTSRYGYNLPYSHLARDDEPFAEVSSATHASDAMLMARFKPSTVRKRAEQTLARIAADRKILELHVGGVSYPDECGLCNEPLPCETVRLLASPYKGREGWQEAWE